MDSEAQVHFQMENTILRISLVVLCMNILVRREAIDLMKYVDDINMSHGGEGTKLYTYSQYRD